MSKSSNDRGRTNPPGNNDESSESEDDQQYKLAGFSNSAPGAFRSKIFSYNSQTEFPTAPLYEVNEEVFIQVVGQSQPAGPYQVMAILANRHYRLRRKDNGQEHSQPVKEDDLVIPVPEIP